MAGGPSSHRHDAAPAPGAAEWFAVSDRGDCSLRLAAGLILGEAPEGTLVLNDPSPECRWLAFDQDPRAGLRVRPLSSDWWLSSDGERLSDCALHVGLTLELPGNTLRISRNIERPAEQGQVVQVGPAAPESAWPVTTLVRPPASPRSERRHRDRGAGTRTPGWSALHGVALGLLATAVALALMKLSGGWGPMADRKPATQADAVDAPSDVRSPAAQPIPLPEPRRLPAAPAAADAESSSAEAPSADPVASAAEAGSVTGTSTDHGRPPAPREAPAVQTAPDADLAGNGPAALPAGDPRVAARLERATALLEAGRITFPPGDNAVAVLVELVEADPSNQQAMALLGICTARLIDQAVAARGAGRDFEARNLLEEVFGFNPEHPGANALWEEWTGAPR